MSKQDIMSIVDKLPDNATIEDIMYSLYIIQKHDKAMGDIASGNVFTSDEVRNSLDAQR